MIFPKYLNDEDTVGVTACSCGVLSKIDSYNKTVEKFNDNKLNIIESNNVKTDGLVSSDAFTRWNELKELLVDDSVKMINVARGGDYLFEMIPYVDFDLIKDNIKWICGSSDPTSLLYIITTKLDIATIYTPCNMTGFDQIVLHDSLKNYFKIIKGEKIKQLKYDKYELNALTDDKYNLDTLNVWHNINGNVDERGIIIGGCIEVLKDIIGTKFDYTKDFLSRYNDKGIIWYFDVFSMSPEVLYNTLLQFKYAGWFESAKAILISKTKYVPDFTSTTYLDVVKKAIDIPCIYGFDVGHVKPSFTVINGSLVHVVSNGIDEYIEML